MCLCILFVGHLLKNRDIKESSFSLSALTTRLYDIRQSEIIVAYAIKQKSCILR